MFGHEMRGIVDFVPELWYSVPTFQWQRGILAMFIGRNEILGKLDALWQKRTPSLVTVRGRRRIGKSTLVAEFAAPVQA